MNFQEIINFKTYNSPSIVNDYFLAIEEGLQAPEKYLFEYLKDKINDKKILDIGIGAGRTTKYLVELTDKYIGIDYSAAMIQKAKEKFQNIDLYIGDARDLKMFEDEKFDFILFSFNGIDSVNHDDRIKIFNEIKRILKKEGYFVFSSHNREYFKKKFKFIYPKKKPIFLVKNLQGIINFYKNKSKEIYTNDYCIVNDSGQNYSLLTYYITMEKQIQQLVELGFNSKILCVNRSGELIVNNEMSKKSVWIYYCVQK